jgi:hypothetical protein
MHAGEEVGEEMRIARTTQILYNHHPCTVWSVPFTWCPLEPVQLT